MRTSPQAGNDYAVSFATDTDVIHGAANYVMQVAENMTSAVDGLIAQLEDLPAGWAGPAAQQFYGPDGAQEHWHRKHRELIDACTAIVDAMRSSATGYDTTEHDSTTTVRNVIPL